MSLPFGGGGLELDQKGCWQRRNWRGANLEFGENYENGKNENLNPLA